MTSFVGSASIETTLVANLIEPLIASGDWDEADRVSAAALRAMTATIRTCTCSSSAPISQTGRGDFGAARTHLAAVRPNWRASDFAHSQWDDVFVAELAVSGSAAGRTPRSACATVSRARSRATAEIRVWLCAEGLRAQAEFAAFARARRDTDAVRDRLDRSRKLRAAARRAAASASPVTPNTDGWRALAEAE